LRGSTPSEVGPCSIDSPVNLGSTSGFWSGFGLVPQPTNPVDKSAKTANWRQYERIEAFMGG
jgi:hypothetical protein